MKIAVCLGVIAGAGYLVLAPAAPVSREPEPRIGGARYRHAPVEVAPGRPAHHAESVGGGRFVAPPVETTDPDLLI